MLIYAVPNQCLGYLFGSPSATVTSTCTQGQTLSATVAGACGAMKPASPQTAKMGVMLMNVCAPDMSTAQCTCSMTRFVRTSIVFFVQPTYTPYFRRAKATRVLRTPTVRRRSAEWMITRLRVNRMRRAHRRRRHVVNGARPQVGVASHFITPTILLLFLNKKLQLLLILLKCFLRHTLCFSGREYRRQCGHVHNVDGDRVRTGRVLFGGRVDTVHDGFGHEYVQMRAGRLAT
jgi:hypothetical protein